MFSMYCPNSHYATEFLLMHNINEGLNFKSIHRFILYKDLDPETDNVITFAV